MFDTISERQAAFGYGIFYFRANFIYPDGDIDEHNRAFLWGSYFAGQTNDYLIDDWEDRAHALMIEQFKWRGA